MDCELEKKQFSIQIKKGQIDKNNIKIFSLIIFY